MSNKTFERIMVSICIVLVILLLGVMSYMAITYKPKQGGYYNAPSSDSSFDQVSDRVESGELTPKSGYPEDICDRYRPGQVLYRNCVRNYFDGENTQ